MIDVKRLKDMLRAARRRWRDGPALRAAAQEADAFLVSYPKSGRTWLRYLLSCYFAETAGLGFVPDLTTMFRVLPNFDCDPVRGIGAWAGGVHDMPLILVSHLRHDPVSFRGKPVIFLVRDPRDVMVSAYYHATRHKGVFTGDVDAFLNDRQYGLPALIAFLNSWSQALDRTPYIPISYEALLRDPHREVVAILEFVGVEPDCEALVRAIATARFDRMRAKERDQGIPGHDYDRNDAQSMRMRSGKAGGFGELLTPEQADKIIARCQAELNPRARQLLATTGFDRASPGTEMRAGAGVI